ncbi:MAG: FAD-dependent monooxygenase [Pseudomonadota bacterium]
MNLQNKTVTVVGGGVAGLASAAALARAGAQVTVHERAPEIAEVGAGLQISANGLRALAALGLDGALREASVPSRGVCLLDGLADRQVVELAPQSPSFFVHRARLIEVLKAGAEAAGATIVTGSKIERGDVPGDYVVAADGVRSVFRPLLNDPVEPQFSGQVAWRAVIADASAKPMADVFMGPGRHLVSYPLAGGLRNIAACEDRRDWVEEGWSIEDRPMNVRAAFARFPARVQDWLAQIDKLYLWGLFTRPVAQTWQDGRVILVGDAAHSTLPYLAQGANLALEDAVVLARALKSGDLPAYQDARKMRAQRVVAAAAANAWKFHLANGLVRQTAFAGLRIREMVRPNAAGRSFGWIWDYDPATVPIGS